MDTSRSATRQARQPSERDQFWLDHEAAAAAAGQTSKEYAAVQGLSLHAFYQARKRLRALSLLAAAPGRRKPAGSTCSRPASTSTPGARTSRSILTAGSPA